MDPATIALIVKLIDLGLVGIGSLVKWDDRAEQIKDKVQQIAAEGRDPTAEELAALKAESDALSARIHARAEQAQQRLT